MFPKIFFIIYFSNVIISSHMFIRINIIPIFTSFVIFIIITQGLPYRKPLYYNLFNPHYISSDSISHLNYCQVIGFASVSLHNHQKTVL